MNIQVFLVLALGLLRLSSCAGSPSPANDHQVITATEDIELDKDEASSMPAQIKYDVESMSEHESSEVFETDIERARMSGCLVCFSIVILCNLLFLFLFGVMGVVFHAICGMTTPSSLCPNQDAILEMFKVGSVFYSIGFFAHLASDILDGLTYLGALLMNMTRLAIMAVIFGIYLAHPTGAVLVVVSIVMAVALIASELLSFYLCEQGRDRLPTEFQWILETTSDS